MLITQVRKGDVIKDHGRKDIEVTKVELNACSSFGVHINSKYCYENTTEVELRSQGKDVDEAEKYFEDQMMDEWSRELDASRV